MRIAAALAAPAFAFAAFSFWRLIADSNVAITVTEQALVVSRPGKTETYPWNALGGYTFSFGVFRVLDKTGRLVLRVEHTIDGFSHCCTTLTARRFAPSEFKFEPQHC